MINLHESKGPGGIEFATPKPAVGHAIDCPTRPGQLLLRMCQLRALRFFEALFLLFYAERYIPFGPFAIQVHIVQCIPPHFNEPRHEISNNVVCDQQSLRSACAYAQSDQNLCYM